MRAKEAAEHLPYSERQLMRFLGNREYTMPEITMIRSRWAFDNLDLLNRFFFREENRSKIIDEIAEEL